VKKQFIPCLLILLARPFGAELYPTADLTQTEKERLTIQHEVTVTLKLVQVYVIDKKGSPVPDLKKDDFIIHDNGKRQTITEFEKHVLTLPSAMMGVKPEGPKETESLPRRELLPRRFLLLFDFANNNAQGILKAKEAALHFIETQLHPSDEVGALSYSALKSLQLHEYLTTDHEKVRKVINGFGLKDAAGRAENFEVEYWHAFAGEPPKDASASGWVFQTPDPQILSLKQKEGLVQILGFTQKMTDLAKALRYIPGHKYIILFSSGIPYSFVYGIQSPFGKNVKEEGGKIINLGSWGETLVKQRYEEMLKELGGSNCAIYALDTEELKRAIEADTRMTGAFSLEKMASATGGKYFGNINNYKEHLDKIQNLTGAFYVLGYYISETWDGAYHRIRVEVRRPGCSVHAQKGYFSPKPFREYTDLEKMLHLVDLALSEKSVSQMPLVFPLQALPCSGDKEANLCLVAKIPADKARDILEGEVEIFSLIFDSAENIVELRRKEEDFSRFQGQSPFYFSFFFLPPGLYSCRFVLRNLETGRGAVGSASATILERREGIVEVYPPLLLCHDKNAVFREGPPPGKSDQKLAGLTLTDYFGFDATQYSPCSQESFPKNSMIPAVVACSTLGLSAPEVEISAYLVEKDTREEVPLDISIVSEREEKETVTFFVNLEIPEVDPGEYALNLFAREKTGGSLSQVVRGLRIR
jgi:VWFA-related protein